MCTTRCASARAPMSPRPTGNGLASRSNRCRPPAMAIRSGRRLGRRTTRTAGSYARLTANCKKGPTASTTSYPGRPITQQPSPGNWRNTRCRHLTARSTTFPRATASPPSCSRMACACRSATAASPGLATRRCASWLTAPAASRRRFPPQDTCSVSATTTRVISSRCATF